MAITKQVAGSAKIDPLKAQLDAVVAIGLNSDQAPLVDESRGLLFV